MIKITNYFHPMIRLNDCLVFYATVFQPYNDTHDKSMIKIFLAYTYYGKRCMNQRVKIIFAYVV